MKVTGTISQKGVRGAISQIGVNGSIAQKGVKGSIVQSGFDWSVYWSTRYPSALLLTVDSSEQITLNWTNNGVLTASDSILIYESTDNVTFTLINTALFSASSYVRTGLDASTLYYYKIRYTRGGTYSAYCDVASATTDVLGTAPVFVSAAVANATPTKVVLTFDQALLVSSTPATADFTVTDHTISGVAISGATVELTLSTAVIYFDVLYFTYTKGANPIKGNVGEIEADSITSTLITNNVLEDGNTVAWYLASDLATITKDGSNFVSRWNDKLASGRDLIQATGTNQPLWNAIGITFDGIDNLMKSAPFVWEQPVIIYAVINQVTWSYVDRIWTGDVISNTNAFYANTQFNVPNKMNFYSGASILTSGLTENTWGIIRVLYNGASSKVIINNGTPTTGNIGASNGNGFTLAAQGGGGAPANIIVKEIILRNIADSTDFETSLYNVIKRRAGL